MFGYIGKDGTGHKSSELHHSVVMGRFEEGVGHKSSELHHSVVMGRFEKGGGESGF